MVRMLMTMNISKGWETWSEMAKSLVAIDVSKHQMVQHLILISPT